MSALACSLLRHDLQPRWVHDVLAMYCHTCGCLFIPDHAPAPAEPITPDREPLPSAYADWAPGEVVEAFGK